MAESILKDQKRVLPTCCYLQGEFGVKGYYVGGRDQQVVAVQFEDNPR
jgi:malate/lactate dehydrogenase